MTLNHSKTWPVSTMAVVQLRVDPNGRTYSTSEDQDASAMTYDTTTSNGYSRETAAIVKIDHSRNSPEKDSVPVGVSGENKQPENGGVVLPLSKKHVELFTKMSCHPHPPHLKHTVRTDTVSTILEQDIELDYESNENGHPLGEQHNNSLDTPKRYEKFHVLALARIDENINETADNRNAAGRRQSNKVDNWDLIYTEANGVKCASRCNDSAVTSYGCKTRPLPPCKEHNKNCLLPDLPLDARKAYTLRRHYYPEGGWGWVVIVCTVLVHVLNHGLQLACSQLVLPAAAKFKTDPVHVAGE